MRIKEITRVLEEYAPTAWQESYDNAGLIVGNPNAKTTGALCCLDITEEILDEAIEKGANLVIAHHPIIFSGLKKLTGSNYVERIVLRAIQKGIALYASHTNMDSVPQGVNYLICEKLGLSNTKILSPAKDSLVKLVTFVPKTHAEVVRNAIFSAGGGHIGNYDCCSYNSEGKGTFRGDENANPFVGEKNEIHFEPEMRIETILPHYISRSVIQAMIAAHPYEEVAYDVYPLKNELPTIGAGMIGEFKSAVSAAELFELIKDTFGVKAIKYTGNLERQIQRVAVCGGSGSFLLGKAIAAGADIFITGDVKYHQFFDAEDKIIYCDIGHYESEQFTKEIFYNLLTKKFSNFAVHLSEIVTNPVKYYL